MKRLVKTSIATVGLCATLLVAGCSGTNSLSTASILGGGEAKPQNLTPQPQDTPTKRALQLGKVSARAAKCGYNFDPQKLKSAFLQKESAAGIGVEQLGQLERTYTTAFNGVSKGVAGQENYCTKAKTKLIKTALTRYLAGDFSSDVVRRVAKKKPEAGVFDWLEPADEKKGGPKFGSQDWWTSQENKL